MPLQAAAAVIAVEAVAAPVVVGAVRLVASWRRMRASVGPAGRTMKKPRLSAVRVPAVRICRLGLRRAVQTRNNRCASRPALPRSEKPASRSRWKKRLRAPDRTTRAVGPDAIRLRVGTYARHFQRVFVHTSGHVKAHLFAGPVAELVGV